MSDSLLNLSRKELQSISTFTVHERFKQIMSKIYRWLKLPLSWIFYIPLVLIVYAITFLELNIPTLFYFKNGEIFQFIERWLSFIIPLFTIIVVSSIFIIQAIQQKNKDDELFSVVFGESWFYPILYISLCIIAIMTFLYFKPIFISERIIIKMTVLSLWLYLFDLLCIGFLFNRAFKFLNTDYLLEKYLNDIMFYFDAEIEREALSRISHRIFNEKMNKMNHNERIFNAPQNYHQITFHYNKRQLVKDVKIKKVIRRLSKSKNLVYTPIHVGYVLPEDFNFIWAQQTEDQDFKSIRKLIVTSDFNEEKSKLANIKERFKGKLDRYVMEENIPLLNQVLDYYKSLYIYFVHLTEKYKLIKIPQINSFFSAGRAWEALEGVDKHIFFAFEKAIYKGNGEASKSILSFVDRIYVLCIRERNAEIFIQYKYMLVIFYTIMFNNEGIKNKNMSWLSLRLRELADTYINYEIEKEKDKEKVKLLQKMQIEFFIIINKLLKKALEFNDFKTYSKLIHELGQIRNIL